MGLEDRERLVAVERAAGDREGLEDRDRRDVLVPVEKTLSPAEKNDFDAPVFVLHTDFDDRIVDSPPRGGLRAERGVLVLVVDLGEATADDSAARELREGDDFFLLLLGLLVLERKPKGEARRASLLLRSMFWKQFRSREDSSNCCIVVQSKS